MADNTRHRDIFAADIDWKPGTDDGVTYARFRLDNDNPSAPLVILSTFEPGVEIDPHTHESNYLEYILEGEQQVGKITYRDGDVRVVAGGTGYGPIKVGPEGCKVLIVFEQATGAISRPVGKAATD